MIVLYPIKVTDKYEQVFGYQWASSELLELLDKNTEQFDYEILTGENYGKA